MNAEKRPDSVAVVPGSFDPVTSGHVDIISRAASIFDAVFVVVMENPDKDYLFNWRARLDFVREAVKGFGNVTAEYYSGFLYEYARSKGACAIVKGARSAADFEYEREMAAFNRQHFPGAETLILCAFPPFEGVSSSLVRQLALSGGRLDGLVTPLCAKALKEIFAK